ncbi:glycoside hydrolase family 5 protein [Lentinula aff. lateritia]|uniref:Glycoside hydrolase family 5 protein n=1 Tax=Lentinula aff. lateritia TaxID=2804960 RepID=A0ACC1U074_9AGAR|nr:glycoside hydrolase family 5 protein [Lentinula aff. lateritia]
MHLLLLLSFLGPFVLVDVGVKAASMPSKVYGVNLGSWLVLESWMLPQGFSFAEAFPDTVDAIFKTHWESWFNQTDVSSLKNLGINTVRIPLGYWIVEQLVNRQTEFYPRGGLEQLIRGLEQLHAAGIVAILDHHALPGVQTPNQMFTGQYVHSSTSPNYLRALTWAGVMTALSHLHPAFASVFAIEAVNEPIMDAAQTPGYGTYQENFVTVVRGVEAAVGVKTQGLDSPQSTANASQAILDFASAQSNIRFNSDVKTAMGNTANILAQIASDDSTQFDLGGSGHSVQTSLVTNFMDVNWQNDDPPNPAAAAWGPQAYDNHLYYVFGGVAAADPQDYMVSICNLGRVQADAALGDSPLWFGEWGLPTQFDATDMFLQEWADAQKLAYSKGAGWIFWNFKVEHSELAGNLSREWSYIDGVELGYLTKDPSTVHNTSVCAPFVTSS